ncbi:MAG: DUF1080 domain-containing protein [Candidatus Latescibacteria bacterium]|nr:DUF1080 domain-containing protein [Candidatus Latescibacterota bacterium]
MKRNVTAAVFLILSITILFTTSCDRAKPVPDLSESPEEGFYRLFNGTDFTGWNIGGVEPDEIAWYAENNVIHCKGEPRSPYLILTEKDYENFDFYAEFKVSKGCNSGIFFHIPLAGRQSYLGFEAQILDDSGKSPDKNSTGAIYDVVPPLKNAMKRAGKWNQYRIQFDWPMCSIWLNGHLVQDTDFSAHPMLKYRMRRGPIGLSNHGHVVEYRNLWIKELPDSDTGAAVFNGKDLTGWSLTGDADWHVQDGMIISTGGEGYLITDNEYENVYFHAYVECDTLQSYNARFFYRWKSIDDPGYETALYDFKDAVKYTAQYGDDIPVHVIRPIRSSWFLYRIISAGQQSQVYLNEHLVSANRLLSKTPRGRIALYRTSEDGIIRVKGLKLREPEGPGI